MLIVPYVEGGLRSETTAALESSRLDYYPQWLDPKDPFAYASLLRRFWRAAGELIVVEQDVVPPAGALAGLLACEREWCGHELACWGTLATQTLGLVRFSSRLRARLPGLADQALAGRPGGASKVRWQACDGALSRHLEIMGAGWHRHDPPATHLNLRHSIPQAAQSRSR